MEDKRSLKEKLFFKLAISIFSLVVASYFVFIILMAIIIRLEHYEIDTPAAFFPPLLSISTITIFCLIFGFAFSIFVSRRFLRPIIELQKGLNEVKNGNFNLKIENIYEDETILKWATEYYPSLVKTTVPEPKHSIDKKELKKLLIIDNNSAYINGMEIPGLTVEVLDDAFNVKY